MLTKSNIKSVDNKYQANDIKNTTKKCLQANQCSSLIKIIRVIRGFFMNNSSGIRYFTDPKYQTPKRDKKHYPIIEREFQCYRKDTKNNRNQNNHMPPQKRIKNSRNLNHGNWVWYSFSNLQLEYFNINQPGYPPIYKK